MDWNDWPANAEVAKANLIHNIKKQNWRAASKEEKRWKSCRSTMGKPIPKTAIATSRKEA